MEALRRYPKSQRRAVAQEWARRSNAAQAQKRMERGPDAETVRKRALHDSRGQVLRSGVCYKAGKEIAWQVRRSIHGRTNQLDLVSNGRVIQTCGKRNLPKQFRPYEN